MADPAVEAAQRALMADGPPRNALVSAAREALKPIRRVLDKLAEDTEPPCDYALQIELFERAISDLSPLVYTSEELDRD